MVSTMDFNSLSIVATKILDFLLNVPYCDGPEGAIETLELSTSHSRKNMENEWNTLIEQHVIVSSDYRFLINPSLLDNARKTVQDLLAEEGITQDSIASYLGTGEKKGKTGLAEIANLLGNIYSFENIERIVFSDTHYPQELIPICDEFTKLGLAFKSSSRSRKHWYLTYYLRSWPFEIGQALREETLRRLNVGGLTSQEWKTLFLLLLPANMQLKYGTVAANIDLPDVELRELITNLKDRGLLVEEAGNVSIHKALASPLCEYFRTSVYPEFKRNTIELIKRKLAASLSYLWPVSSAKRIIELDTGKKTITPVPLKLVDKSAIHAFEGVLPDLTRLGVVLDIGDKVAIVLDVLKEVENWLGSSIRTSTVFIPTKDFYLARKVLHDLFSRCDTYVKIQDPYLGEESMNVLEYVPHDMQIYILAGIRLASGEDAESLCNRIERFLVDRRDKFDICFVAKETGATPFHDMFIISRRHAWTSGTSLKQIGREKDTAITEFSKEAGGEQIELAFDNLWFADIDYLRNKGYIRLDFEGWKGMYGLSE